MIDDQIPMGRSAHWNIASDESWRDLANCAGIETEMFFPERGEDYSHARATCAGCEVTDACLDYAILHGIKWGMWGGKSERERRRMRRVTHAS